MIEEQGDLWDAHSLGQWVVITTSGAVNSRGHAIMGKGIAREAAVRHPLLPVALGTLLSTSGNNVYRFDSLRLFTFPTKHHWQDRLASLPLIVQSAQQLVDMTPDIGLVYMVRPGCGNGRLLWSHVKVKLEEILTDDKFIVVERP